VVFGLGVLLAAFIKTFKWDKKIRKRLARAGWGAIFLATGAGLVSPLCSCGVVPLVISLIYGGVPLAPVFALLITSPLMSPDAFLITLRGLGPALAFGKLRRGVRGPRERLRVSGCSGSGGSARRGCSAASPRHRECLDDAARRPAPRPRVPERRLWYFGLMVKDRPGSSAASSCRVVLEAAIVAFVPLGLDEGAGDGPAVAVPSARSPAFRCRCPRSRRCRCCAACASWGSATAGRWRFWFLDR
jgi:hypothetical protein